MPVKKFVGNAMLAAVAAASIIPAAEAVAAPHLVINGGAQIDIKSPPGFNYVATGSGAASTLNVTTEGYVFCANIGMIYQTPVSMQPQHERWSLPSANEIRSVGYSGGTLSVNGNLDSSLACQVRGASGELATPFSGFGNMLFHDGYDPFAARQFSSLVNWQPDSAFSWAAPDWTQVPNDSCSWDMNPNTPVVPESAVCAAATGVSQVAVGSQNDTRFGDRAPTMWTATTTANFIYLARIDARFGPQDGAPNSHFPVGARPAPQPDSGSSIDIAIRDGYDSTYLAGAATYCLLRELPATLTDNVCSGQAVYFSDTLTGNLEERIPLDMGWTPAKSLYVAVVRQKSGGSSPATCQPTAAIAAIADPDVSRHEGGDEFIGDNVVFGFRPGDSFEWMGCVP
jgi:hypothetical protein